METELGKQTSTDHWPRTPYLSVSNGKVNRCNGFIFHCISDLEDGSYPKIWYLTQSKLSSSPSSEIQVPVVPVDQEKVEHWSDNNQEQESEATFIPRFAMSIITFARSIFSMSFYRFFGFHSEQN